MSIRRRLSAVLGSLAVLCLPAPPCLAAAEHSQVHCRIAGVEFDASDPILASFVVPPNGAKSHLSLLAGHGSGTGQLGHRTQVNAKAENVTATGTYPMSSQATWRSSAVIDGKALPIDSGSIVLTTFNPTGDRHAAGKLTFSAAGQSGQCTFDVIVVVADYAKGPAPGAR